MTKAHRLLEKLKKLDGQHNKEHDKYHERGMPHTHKPGG